MNWITFNLGVPCSAPIVVENFGICQFRKHYENGDVLLYMGGNRMFKVDGSNRWRYA